MPPLEKQVLSLEPQQQGSKARPFQFVHETEANAMVKEAGFWACQEDPTGMDLAIDEHDPTPDGTITYWWSMEEAADEAPYMLEVSALGYFSSMEEAYEDALDFAENHRFEIRTSREDALAVEEL
jgi:hypothetical protein